MSSSWVSGLERLYGDRLVVGAVPRVSDDEVWVSSRDEEMPTAAEHEIVVRHLTQGLRDYCSREAPDLRWLARPAVVGDFFYSRTEVLIAPLEKFIGRESVFVGLVGVVQHCLCAPFAERWRVGYLSPVESLLVYPGSVFLGQRGGGSATVFSFEDVRRWLALQVAVENSGGPPGA